MAALYLDEDVRYGATAALAVRGHVVTHAKDFAPTVASALGLRPPRHSRGAVLHDVWAD